MQVFDYHINPKLKRGLAFKSFYFQPENQEQKDLGNLCLVVELSNALSKDSKMLNALGNTIKQEFFSDPKRTPEQSLKEALKKANHFLQDLADKGNVRWLGNLNAAVIAIKDFTINFSKTGNIKILLLRGNEYHNIADNLEFQQPSAGQPNQPFLNAALGKLAEEDKLIILTQDIFEFFYADLAEKILAFPELAPKTLNRILKTKKEEMKNFSGILFLILMQRQRSRRFPLSFLKFSFPLIEKTKKIRKEIRLIIALLLILLISYLIFRR